MVDAHERVVGVVEEMAVAEVEVAVLVAADVEIAHQRSAVADDEGVARQAFDVDDEPHAGALAEPADVRVHAQRGFVRHRPPIGLQTSRDPRGSIGTPVVAVHGFWHNPAARLAASSAPRPRGGDVTEARPVIAVFGSSTVQPGDAAWNLAHDLGRALANAGAAIMTGGYSGTMEACSRGAHEAGGHVVGVTVELFETRGPANRWVEERVHTATLYQRLEHLIEKADGFVVLPGSLGTLTELFLAWTLLSVEGRRAAPLVLLGDHWEEFLGALRHPDMVLPGLFSFVEVARDADDAARRALAGVAPAPRGR